jgi:hypothetical protein
VIGEQFPAVAAWPSKKGTDGGGGECRHRAKPEENTGGYAEIKTENPMQSLKRSYSGKEPDRKVDDERMKPPDEQHEFDRDRGCRS